MGQRKETLSMHPLPERGERKKDQRGNSKKDYCRMKSKNHVQNIDNNMSSERTYKSYSYQNQIAEQKIFTMCLMRYVKRKS